MTQYIIVLPPSVISTEVTLNDNFAGYEHVFMLQYISTEVTPITTATFTFGKYSSYYHIYFVEKYILFYLLLADKKILQIQFGPIDYCLNWEVCQLNCCFLCIL